MPNPFLDPLQFNKVKAFLGVLIRLNFNLAKVEPKFIADGMTLKKAECLELLHKIPGLEGKSNEEVVKFLANPANFKAFIHSKDFTEEQRLELEGVVEDVETEKSGKWIAEEGAPGQENLPIQTSAVPAGGMGLPAAPSISTPQVRFRQPAPPTPVPTKELYIADSSGNVVGKEIITPTSVHQVAPGGGPSEVLIADREGKVIGKLTSEPPAAPQNVAAQAPQPRIITPTGAINEPPKEILIADRRNNVTGTHKISTPKQSGGLGQRISSLGRNGLNTIRPALGKAFNTGLNGLDNLNNLGKNRPGNKLRDRFRNRFKQSGKTMAKRSRLLIAGIAIIGVMIFTGAFFGGIPPGGVPTGQAAPITPGSQPGSDGSPATTTGSSETYGLDYTLPLKNTSVIPTDIKATIKAAFPGAKLEYWEKIVQSSLAAGWNPALALALWIEETGASQTTFLRNGGSEIPVNGAYTKGHLGCAPTEDQNIDESLSCLFKFGSKNNFTDDQFPKFMALYSGGPTNDPFSNNPNFTRNFKAWYSLLVPSGIGAIAPVLQPTASPTNPAVPTIASCPVPNGKITTHSYDTDKQNGHCSPGSYEFNCSGSCPTWGRRAKAIDIDTGGPNGKDVILPTLEGKVVQWTFLQSACAGRLNLKTLLCENYNGGTGYIYTFSSQTWAIQFVHMDKTALHVTQTYPSGTVVGKTDIDHVHTTIGKDIKDLMHSGNNSTDCDNGWLASDFMCQ